MGTGSERPHRVPRPGALRGFQKAERILSLHVGRLAPRPITMLLQENPRTGVVVHQPDDHITGERLEELTRRITAGHVDGPAKVRRLRSLS